MCMSDIQKFRTIYKLKSVYRSSQISDRHESSAEHSWSCLLLADFLLSRFNIELDRLKVYELLMYHDVVEIEAGDIPAHLVKLREEQKEKELEAAKLLEAQFPNPINNKFKQLFLEFEEQKTLESKFAKAVDALDPVIHQLDNKDKWSKWPRSVLIERKLKYFEEFPEIKELFFEIIAFVEENNYFSQVLQE